MTTAPPLVRTSEAPRTTDEFDRLVGMRRLFDPTGISDPGRRGLPTPPRIATWP